MSRLEKIIIVFLTASLLFSENTGKAFFYSCCLLGLWDRQRILFWGIATVFFDIYHSAFVGISFLSLIIIMIVVEKYESVLLNLPIWAKLYYQFMIVCCVELICCLFTILLDGKLNFYSHFLIIIKSIFFCYVLESSKEHARGS